MNDRDAYAAAGVDTDVAGRAVAGLVSVLATIDPGREKLAQLGSGHYANVLKIADNLGIAISTDGVGSKVVLAEQMGRFDTIGVDCIAMNVNDIICVGAEPLAVVDYIAVEAANEQMLHDIAVGLKAGAELAGVEIPGGELAQLPELIRGHPSPTGFDLVAACFGTVALDAIVTGDSISPGDAIIGLPSSGVHSNGYTLARHCLFELADYGLDQHIEALGKTVGEALLEPTEIYVRPVLELLRSGCDVRGLAHITSGGVLNLLRLNKSVGYEIDATLPVPPIFDLIQTSGSVGATEMHEVFNMGCGFCCVVAADDESSALGLLQSHYPTAATIGRVNSNSGAVTVPQFNLSGSEAGLVSSPAVK